MNNQFKNSNFGFFVYATIIVIIMAATIFMIWYMTIGYRIGTYSANTMVGSVYVGGLTDEEVTTRIEDKTAIWYNDDSIVFEVVYQNYRYSIDRKLMFFDTELTMKIIEDGVANSLVVSFTPGSREYLIEEINNLEFLQDLEGNIDIEKLVNDLRTDASLMKSFSSKNIENYILDMDSEVEVLDETRLYEPDDLEFIELNDKITSLYENGEIVVPKKALFSTIDIFKNVLSDAEMTLLSSAMLDLILETNMILNEVHYDPRIIDLDYTIENYPFYHRNASISQIVDKDFAFYNPNNSDYMFKLIQKDDGNIYMQLIGLPLQYDIQVNITQTEVPYITQETDQLLLAQNGYNGVIVEAERVIKDLDNDIIYRQIILFEFYTPTKKIIYRP